MSSNESVFILMKWCRERTGVRLKKEYLEDWCRSHSSSIRNTEAAYKELLTDFTNTDISTTSETVIQQNFGNAPEETFPEGHLRKGGGVVLQIQDAMDISNSTLSLLNTINRSGPIRHQYIERRATDDVEFPRGTLRWTLTDGYKQIQAMEMEKIPNINLKTPFGTKLLISSCEVRRGMLLLYKDKVKVLGGDVPEIYGGNMLVELERRFKMKLGLLEEPSTPTPNTSGDNSTFNRTFVGQDNTFSSSRTFVGEDSTMSERTFVNTPATAESLVEEIEDFGDDDFGDDDIDYDAIEEFQEMEEDTNTNIPTQNEPYPVFDDDDDFMEPVYKSPVRSSPAKPSPARLSLSKSKRTKTPPTDTQQTQQPSTSSFSNTQARNNNSRPSTSTQNPQIRNNQPSTPTQNTQLGNNRPSSSTQNTQVRNNQVPTPAQNTQPRSVDSRQDKSKGPEDIQVDSDTEADLSWVDSSVWEGLDQYERIDMDVDQDGRAQCTFEELKRSLKATETGKNLGELPDIVVVRVKCHNLGKLIMNPSGTLHLELQITDPVDTSLGIVTVVFDHDLLGKLLGHDHKAVADMFKQRGMKEVARKVFVPFMNKVKSQKADIEIDFTVLQGRASKNVDSKEFLPTITKFDLL